MIEKSDENALNFIKINILDFFTYRNFFNLNIFWYKILYQIHLVIYGKNHFSTEYFEKLKKVSAGIFRYFIIK